MNKNYLRAAEIYQDNSLSNYSHFEATARDIHFIKRFDQSDHEPGLRGKSAAARIG